MSGHLPQHEVVWPGNANVLIVSGALRILLAIAILCCKTCKCVESFSQGKKKINFDLFNIIIVYIGNV